MGVKSMQIRGFIFWNFLYIQELDTFKNQNGCLIQY